MSISDLISPNAMTAPQDPGWRELLRLIDGVRSGEIESPEDVARRIGWHGFLWLIRHRLDEIYPEPHFGVETFGVLWPGDHGGRDIDPGVRWVTLLRLALEQLDQPA